MKNKIHFIALFILYSSVCLAQNIFTADTINNKSNFEIKIIADFTAKSNTLENNFYTTFYQGGYINDDIKNKVSSKLKPTNRLGADANYDICFKQKFDTIFKQTGWSYMVRYSDKVHLATSFTHDFFNVAFIGNHSYENATAHLAPFKFNYFNYQQIGAGVEKQIKTNAAIHHIGIAGNYLNGKNIQYFDITKGDLFTATDGEYLTLDLSGNYVRGDTAKTKNKIGMPTKGKGFSLDAYYKYADKHGNTIEVMMNDFGYLYWNKSSISYHQDTSIYFDGIGITNVFQINDSILKLSTDSLTSIIKDNKKQSLKMALPAWFNLLYSKQINAKWNAFVGGTYRSNDVYLPLLLIGARYNPVKTSQITAQIGYGGYGKWNYGLIFKQQILNHLMITLGTKQLEGFIQPKTGNGQSLFIGISGIF